MDKCNKAGDEANAKAEAAGDMVVQALADVLEVADMMQAPAVEVRARPWKKGAAAGLGDSSSE